VDIFCAPSSEYSPKRAAESTRAGKQVWIYNGVRPFTGSFVIDDVAVSTRVNPWIQYKFNIPRWFYWESTYYKDTQGKRGNIDVLKQPINFTNRDGDRMNGDGLLIYPGRDHLFPASDQGLDYPLASIRLKNWRRGIQDVEYLVLAKKAGHQALVERLLRKMLKRALKDETSEGRAVGWPESGEIWLEARRALFAALKTGKAVWPRALGLLEPTDAAGDSAPQGTTTTGPTAVNDKGGAPHAGTWRGRDRYLIAGGAGVLLLALAGLFLLRRSRS
jgi:hypothetical protein